MLSNSISTPQSSPSFNSSSSSYSEDYNDIERDAIDKGTICLSLKNKKKIFFLLSIIFVF